MKTLVYYFIQMIVTSGILYSYYHFVLRNKRFHHYNRFYLLAAVVISILIPFLNIPVYFTAEQASSSLVLQTLSNISPGEAESVTAVAKQSVIAQTKSSWFTWQNLSYAFYLLIAVFALVKIIFSLSKIRSMIRRNASEKLEGIQFVNTDEPGTPFSFFHWLFWNRKIELHSEKGEQVFRHEIFHIQQRHSLDILFMELATIVFWINPFFHLIKKETKAIHEFLADEFAINKTEKWKYAELLLMQAFNTQNPLLNPFFNNQIKRRIAMITSLQKTSYQYLRKLMVLPIAIIVIALFAFNYKANRKPTNLLTKPITVVIDAGHGMNEKGAYTGAIGLDGSYEDQIVLDIAKKIKELNTDKNVNIVLTRETKDDVDLHKRSDISNQKNADLFISIHANTASSDDPATSGAQVFISKKNKTHFDDNNLLGKSLLDNFASSIKVNSEVKMRETGIFVLDNSNCPAVVIECGFMSDKNDLNFMKSATGQQQIAKAILNAIEQYGLRKQTTRTEDIILYDTTKPRLNVMDLKLESTRLEKVVPTAEQLKTWQDAKVYGVWIDGKRISNELLQKYQAKDFSHYFVSKLSKTAVNYGKHYYQVDLMTNSYFQKRQKDLTITKDDMFNAAEEKFKNYLILVDGKEWSYSELGKLDVNDIKQIAVNNQSAISKYGEKAKNGVVEIFTKTAKDIKVEDIILTDSSHDASFPGGQAALNETPTAEIRLSDLKQTTASTLIRLPEGELTSFRVTINDGDGKWTREYAVVGKDFSDEVKRCFENIQDDGTLLTIEDIKYKNKNSYEGTYPSLFRIVKL